MNFPINKILVGVVIAGAAFWYFRDTQQIASVDETLARRESQLDNDLEVAASDPLTNNAATLETIVISNKTISNQLREKDVELNHMKEQLALLQRNQDKGDTAQVTQLQMQVNDLIAEQQRLTNELLNVKNQQSTTDQQPYDTTGGMVDANVAPVNVTPIENQDSDSNDLIGRFIQPVVTNAKRQIDQASGVDPIQQQVDDLIVGADNGIVWVKQSDLTETTDKEGKVTTVYAKTFTDGQPSTVRSNADTGFNQPTASELGQTEGSAEEEIKEVPIYTIPPNATFFGSVGMSAIIGRVPVDNQVQNAFRFKVLVGADNLASNGHYIPNLDTMSLSGYATGDFTLECARGTIDTALFTFRDGTVRVVKGESLGHISDQYGVPCIAGQYITNFPDYMAKRASLSMLSSFAASIADAASTTTTTDTGVTTTVVNNATQKALGDGGSAAASDVSEWFEKRQTSAFDVVFIKTGEPLVVNIDDFIKIDYELEGRKLFHSKNAQEYKL